MQLAKYMQGDVTVIALEGRLDSDTSARVQQDLDAIVPESALVLLDLSRVSYMSSAGLRVLLLLYRQANQCGATIALAAVPPDAYEIMSTTGFLGFFTVAGSVADGVTVLTT